jgi:methionine-rich copper-binding protein CopC
MTDERIIAYLLGELPEEESEQFEDECFAQEIWPAEVHLGEEDLIDAYLRDELTQERRQCFERHYLSTQARQERVVMAAAILRQVDECHDSSKTAFAVKHADPTWTERFRSFWNSQGWALRAAVSFGIIAILAGTLWLSIFRAPSPKTFAAITLAHSVNNRAEGVQASKVKLPLNADALRITLTLPERLPPSVRYRVELENEDGETRPLEIAGQDAQTVSVVIPSSQLERGQYALNLFATGVSSTEQPISGSYFFTVE